MKRIVVFLMFMFALVFMPAQAMAININIPAPNAEAKGKEKKAAEPEPAKPGPTAAKPTPEAEKTKAVEMAKDPGLITEDKPGKIDNLAPERFPFDPSRPPVKVQILLTRIHDRVPDEKRAISDLERLGIMPASLSEYLALGSDYPEIEMKFKTVVLASKWWINAQPDSVAPFIYKDADRRYLCLVWAEQIKESNGGGYHVYGDCYRVVADRKQ